MYRKVEAARALNRRTIRLNSSMTPRLEMAVASKVTSTQAAFEVASEALQIFGGNGLSREYPIEKMLRDARASMIEDGCNHVLGAGSSRAALRRAPWTNSRTRWPSSPAAPSGIGLAIARRCASEGMRLVLADVDREALDASTAELTGEGTQAVGVVTDVTDPASMDALLAASLEAHGAVHLVCLNAGVAFGGPAWEIPLDAWRWVLEVNLFGIINGIHTFVPHLMAQGEGHVVTTASVAGLVSAPGISPYNASKHAAVTITETLLQDLRMAGSPIGVSVLCPAFVRTRIHEAERNAPAGVASAMTTASDAVTGAWSVFGMLVEAGIPAEDVADAVVQAVREDRFYILTHPESLDWIRARFETILGGGDPTSPVPLG